MSPLKKLEPVRIFEQVGQQIRELIVSGELQPGDKLPSEQELEKQLSVSRSSIREALRVLEVEGFVEVRRGSRTYITSITGKKKTSGEVASWLEQREELLDEVMATREYIEGLTAALSAQNATDEELSQIKGLLGEMEKMMSEKHLGREIDLNRMVDLDSKFHLAIGQSSRNMVSFEVISRILPVFQESNKAVIYVSGDPKAILREHLAILAAIEAKDAKAAEDEMRKHITRVRRQIQAIILQEQSGEIINEIGTIYSKPKKIHPKIKI